MPAHLHKRKGRRIWEIVEGRKRITTGTTRRSLAEEALVDYYRRKRGMPVDSKRPVQEFVMAYLEHSKSFNKSTTIDDKRRTLNNFVAAVGVVPVSEVLPQMVMSYLANRIGARTKQPIGAERWNSERQILGNFFRWLQWERMVNGNPAAGIRKRRVVRSKIPKVLTLAQERQLLAWCQENDPELRCMAIVVGNTGIRVRELANLAWSDVSGPLLLITAKEDWTPKDYDERSIPLSQIAKEALAEQKQASGHRRWVFPRQDGKRYGRGLDMRMVRAFKEAGLGAGGFHRLRHTYATRAIEAGMDTETLRRILGHADTKTLLKYSHVSPEHIRRAARLVKFGEQAKVRVLRPAGEGGAGR